MSIKIINIADMNLMEWDKKTRVESMDEIVKNNWRVVYNLETFLIGYESKENILPFPTDYFVYNYALLDTIVDLYHDTKLKCVVTSNGKHYYCEVEFLSSGTTIRINETDLNIKDFNVTGQGIEVIFNYDNINEDNSSDNNTSDNDLNVSNILINVLYTRLDELEVELNGTCDPREIIFDSTSEIRLVSKYINRVSQDLIDLIPEYRKFKPFNPNDEESSKGLDSIKNVIFYNIPGKMIMVEADNSTISSFGEEPLSSGLKMKYINNENKLIIIPFPTEYYKGCKLSLYENNQYVVGVEELLARIDSNGLVYQSNDIKSLKLFNLGFTPCSEGRLCCIKNDTSVTARIKLDLCCELSSYDYLLSDCYKEDAFFTIGKKPIVSNETTIPMKAITEKHFKQGVDFDIDVLSRLDNRFDFKKLFDSIKDDSIQYEVFFQLNLYNIDATKDNVYFDKSVKYNDVRHVNCYLINDDHPMILFDHSMFSLKTPIFLESINYIKINGKDAIECKSINQEKVIIYGSEETGSIAIQRSSDIEHCIPVNALATFNENLKDYNIYTCELVSFYARFNHLEETPVMTNDTVIDSFLSIYIGNDEARKYDDMVYTDFYAFCNGKIDEYKSRLSMDKKITFDYFPNVKKIYDDIKNGDSHVESYYLFIGIDYNYNYVNGAVKGGSVETIKHYFEKMLEYHPTTPPVNNNGIITYDHGTVEVVSTNSAYTSIESPFITLEYDDCNTEGIKDDKYIINMNEISVDTLEAIVINGPLSATTINGEENNITDYMENNGINMNHVRVFNGKSFVLFPIDFTDDTNAKLESVTIDKIIFKCIPAVKS